MVLGGAVGEVGGLIMAGGLALFPLMILDMMIGAYGVSPPIVVLKAVIDAVDPPIFNVPHDTYLVVWQIRLPPETLASLILGASLASAGSVLQGGILRNPLASTYTLGVSAAAGFGGAAVAILLGAGYVIKYYLPVITQALPSNHCRIHSVLTRGIARLLPILH